MASQQCSLPQTWSVWNGISCFAGWLRHLRPCGHLGYVPLNIVYILVTKSVMTITNVHLTQLCEISLSPFVDNQTNASWTLPPPSPTPLLPLHWACNIDEIQGMYDVPNGFLYLWPTLRGYTKVVIVSLAESYWETVRITGDGESYWQRRRELLAA